MENIERITIQEKDYVNYTNFYNAFATQRTEANDNKNESKKKCLMDIRVMLDF